MRYISRFNSTVALGLAVLLAACGGGGGGGGAAKPVANVVASAENVATGTTVNFNSTGSSSSSGGSLSYQWSVIAKPEGGTATLSSSNASSTELTPDVAGTWTVSLTVNNGTTASDPVHKSVTVTAPPRPVALIAPVNGALPSLGIQLDGSGSTPPAGGEASALRYEWTLFDAPAESTAEIDNGALATPRFTPVLVGSYKVRLVVHYGEMSSEPVEQSIEVVADTPAPTAVPKLTTATPTRGTAVQLNGNESINPDGQPLNFFWRFGTSTFGRPYPTSGRPLGSNAVIDNPTSATPSFVPDIAGNYELQLIVWSGKRLGIASIRVSVAKPADAANAKPVAVITPTYSNYSFEAEPAIASGGSFALGHQSYDLDGDALTIEWTLLSHPTGFNPTTSFTPGTYASFVPTHVGSYVAQLRVSDGKEWSEPVSQVYKVLTGANIAPTATIKTAIGGQTSRTGGQMLRASTQVGDTVTLDGTASIGGNGDQVFYNWELVYRPPGSEAKLDEVRATHPKFTADKEGPYLVRLRVQDAFGLWSRGTPEILIVARVNNSAPVLRPSWGGKAGEDYSNEQPILLRSADQKRYYPSIYILPNALDADGDSVDTLLSLVDAPTGGWPETRQWTASTISESGFSSTSSSFFQPTVSGNYRFQMIANDGADSSALHTLVLPMATVADYPSLLLRRGGGGANFPLWTFENSTFDHLLFPFASVIGNTFGPASQYWAYSTGAPASEGWMDHFKLNAPSGKSYTIIDVKAESEDPTVPANFIGLTEGQVIAAGTSVEFTLNVKRWTTDRVDSNPATPYPKARWSFRVKERPEWTFNEEIPLYGMWREATAPSPDP